jgi:hypothetical protein
MWLAAAVAAKLTTAGRTAMVWPHSVHVKLYSNGCPTKLYFEGKHVHKNCHRSSSPHATKQFVSVSLLFRLIGAD